MSSAVNKVPSRKRIEQVHRILYNAYYNLFLWKKERFVYPSFMPFEQSIEHKELVEIYF